MTFKEELALLAHELQADDPDLTDAYALALAEVIIEDLYRTALEWNIAAAHQQPVVANAA